MHRSIFITIIFFLLLTSAAKAYAADRSVTNSSQLQQALNAAAPGDTILVQNSTYQGTFTISRSGTANAPIIIRAQNPHLATFQNSTFNLNGNYIILEGFIFQNSKVTIQGNYNEVSRNIFRSGGNEYAVGMIHTASHNRIHHNELTAWGTYGFKLTSLRNGMTGNRIDRNYIHDYSIVSGPNMPEAIQVNSGREDTNLNIATIVEYNLIERVKIRGELLSLKSSGNTIRGNTFKDYEGTVQSRHGNNNTFINNTLINGHALQTYGDNHKIFGNRLRNAPLHIPDGDCVQTQVVNGQGCHPAARNAIIDGNIMETNNKIFIGKSTCCGGNYPASQTLVGCNQGPVDTSGNQTGTRIENSSCQDRGQPVTIAPADVGPNAPDTGIPGGTVSACTTLDKSKQIPQGYAASYNVHSDSKELHITASCPTKQPKVTVAKDKPEIYIFNKAYKSSGINWIPFTYACSGESLTDEEGNKWCKGNATTTLSQTDIWVVAYTCQKINNQWKCGCRDSACPIIPNDTSNQIPGLWQLQGIKK